jgi:hypothetical protein
MTIPRNCPICSGTLGPVRSTLSATGQFAGSPSSRPSNRMTTSDGVLLPNVTPTVAAATLPAPLARQSLAAAGFPRVSRFPYCNVIDTILRRPVEIKPSTSGESGDGCGSAVPPELPEWPRGGKICCGRQSRPLAVSPPTCQNLCPLLAARSQFGADALAYCTERLDRRRRAWPLAAALHQAKRNKALENSRFIGLARDGASAGRPHIGKLVRCAISPGTPKEGCMVPCIILC